MFSSFKFQRELKHRMKSCKPTITCRQQCYKKWKNTSRLSRSVFDYMVHSGNQHKPIDKYGFARLCGSTAMANMACCITASTMMLFTGDLNMFNGKLCDVFKESQLFKFQYLISVLSMLFSISRQVTGK